MQPHIVERVYPRERNFHTPGPMRNSPRARVATASHCRTRPQQSVPAVACPYTALLRPAARKVQSAKRAAERAALPKCAKCRSGRPGLGPQRSVSEPRWR
eukprot:3854117-Prymnesium_polylepis.1